MAYPEKYDELMDVETWEFIRRTDSWYPPDAASDPIERQREIYDAMCREFFHGYPAGVTANDRTIMADGIAIPVRDYLRAGGTAAAHVVYYHGGGFVVGGLESHDDVCAEICEATGFAVTSVDYRLCPEHPHPAAFDDALAAFRAVASATALPLIVAGDSAGGNLAAAVSHATRADGRKPVGQVLIYPGLGGDMTKGSYVSHAKAPMLTTADVEFYKTIRGALPGDPTAAPLADTDFSGLPPTVAISAECDPLDSDCEEYTARLIGEGIRAVWFREKGLTHGYLRARHSVARARRSFDRITAAIGHLGRGEWPY